MKRYIFILLFGIVGVSTLRAQGVPVTEVGTTSIDVTLNGFGNFGPTGAFVGSTPPGSTTGDSVLVILSELIGQRFVRPLYGLGLTFYVADDVALRLGFGANVAIDTRDKPTSTISNPESFTDVRMAYGFSPAIEVHFAQAGPVSIYTGGVFSVALAFQLLGFDDDRTTHTQLGYGGGALLGADFYLFSNLSLGLESQFGIEASSTSSSRDGESTDGPTTTNVGFGVPLRVGASFHF